MGDRKDEIISMQLDLIRKMTENNIRRLSDDIWGPRREAESKDKDPFEIRPGMDFPKDPSSGGDAAEGGDSSNKTKASDGGDGGSVTEKEDDIPPKEDMADLKAELDSYIGLGEVKKEVKNLINMATVYQLRKEHDLPTADMSLHMVFSGNPGTGKTMIARFMARVYHSLGLLSKGKLVEVDRSGLVAGYIGQTAIKTSKVLELALGSVLFIDEAYSLTSKSENDFGFEAVDTILKYMEDHRDDIVVIVAGYTELMEEFVNSNPGLRSRFNKYIDFADYTADEMYGIFKLNCKKSCYELAEDAEQELKDYFEAAGEYASDFGNARGVRNTFEKLLTEQANRIAEMDEVSREDLMKITKADVLMALYEKTEEDGEEAAEGPAEEAGQENAFPFSGETTSETTSRTTEGSDDTVTDDESK